MDEVKRLNYFDSQFLKQKDFQDEQIYHRNMRYTHNRLLHSWGIADGLIVTKTGDKGVTISPGVAIDNQGREIVVPDNPLFNPIDLSKFGANATVYLTIKYDDTARDETDRYQSSGIDNYIRIPERPKPDTTTNPPLNDGSVILLAQITLDNQGNVSKIDNSNVRRVGAKLAPDIQNTISAAALFINQYDLGKRILTDEISFNETNQNNETKRVSIGFLPKLIIFGGISKWTVSSDEFYSGTITGFVNNQKPQTQLHCFCTGAIKTSANPNSWIPDTREGPNLCNLSYTDKTKNLQSNLFVDIPDISNTNITVQFRRNKGDNYVGEVEAFKIQIWLLCLG